MNDDFFDIKPIDSPIVEKISSMDADFSLDMDYQRIPNSPPSDYICKFRIMLRLDVANCIKIKHGFCFRVKDPEIMNNLTSDKLVVFFSTLLEQTIIASNSKITGGRIQIPFSHLQKFVAGVLVSSKN